MNTQDTCSSVDITRDYRCKKANGYYENAGEAQTDMRGSMLTYCSQSCSSGICTGTVGCGYSALVIIGLYPYITQPGITTGVSMCSTGNAACSFFASFSGYGTVMDNCVNVWERPKNFFGGTWIDSLEACNSVITNSEASSNDYIAVCD